MTLPEGPAGRRLAAALLLALLAGLWAGVAQPLLDLRREDAIRIDERRALAERYARAAAELPALRLAAAFVEQRPGARLLDGSTDALAAARLATLAADVVAAAGGAVRSVETLPATAVEGHRKVGVRLAVDGTLTSLVRGLEGLEAVVPLVLVERLELRTAAAAAAAFGGGQAEGAAPGSGGEAEPTLAVGLDLFGFRAG